MSATTTNTDIFAHMLTWCQMCSATVDLLESVVRAETTDQTGQLLVVQAGIKAVWSEMLEMMEKTEVWL